MLFQLCILFRIDFHAHDSRISRWKPEVLQILEGIEQLPENPDVVVDIVIT